MLSFRAALRWSASSMPPMSLEHGWGREVFSFALAVQNLLWGAFQPFAGGIADRYGAVRVLWVGAIAYAAGLVLMAYADTAGVLDLSAGVLIGFALSSCSFTIVIGAFGKLLPDAWRSTAFGLGTAAGSFGQFLFSPLARFLIDLGGWQNTLVIFGGMMLLILPLALALASPKAASAAAATARPQQSVMQALREAFAHRSYVLLVLGFFTCGFQLAFVTVHLPAYLLDRGLSADVGAWTIAVIGLFNIVGSLSSGWLGNRMPKRYILSTIYFARALAVVAFIVLPATTTSALVFGAVTGFLWLSTVPPTSEPRRADVRHALARHAVRLLLFFSHQVGGFLGVLLGGYAYEHTAFVQLGVVAVGAVRPALRPDQPADRREAGRPPRRRAGVIG